MQIPHLSRTWLLILIVLLSVAGTAAADSPVLGPAPRAAEPAGPTHAVVPPARSSAGGYRQYLPLVFGQPSWVNISSRAAARQAYLEDYLASENVQDGWSGDFATCSPGATSDEFRAAVLRRVNYFRSMAGVPAVRLDAAYNIGAQAAALMMSRNNAVSPAPPTSWLCYDPAGANAAARSNIYLGINGPAAITGYIRDPGLAGVAAGHRRWILYPPTRFMGTGDTPAASLYPASNVLWVIDDHASPYRPSTRDFYVAWPPPGFVPYQVIFPRWSFSHPGANFDFASVGMSCSGRSIAVEKATPMYGFGEPTLVWRLIGFDDWANWPKPAYDQLCRVSIRGALLNGARADFDYQVTIFDPE